MDIVIVAPRETAQKEWLKILWQKEWGGDPMVSGPHRYHLSDLMALLALHQGSPVGAVTWSAHGTEGEIVSLNALTEGQHVGTRLIRAVEDTAQRQGLKRLYLVTTNDNLRALAFYQKRGYQLHSVNRGAVDRARKTKPTIPVVAENGIPIHDELVLDKWLESEEG